MPGVSNKSNAPHFIHLTSRVTPALSPVLARFCPLIRFTSVLLPVFGIPATIKRKVLFTPLACALARFSFEIPGGAFYVMAALPVDDTDKFQQWLLEEFDDNGETVMFAPAAPMYATPGKGGNEIRMAYVIESEKLARAMEILKKGIEVYNKK